MPGLAGRLGSEGCCGRMNNDIAHLNWSSASRTDVGMVRKLNEDSVLDLPEPLDYWTLRDFSDIVPIASYAS